MTLNEVTNQVYGLAVGGYFNREKFTKTRFVDQVKAMFKGDSKEYILEIALPDGWWYMSIEQYRPGEYDYFIPDNREQETRLTNKLFKAAE